MRRALAMVCLLAACGGDDEVRADAEPPPADAGASDAASLDAAADDGGSPTVVSVTVSPGSESLVGEGHFTATALFSDLRSEDVTLVASWTSSDPMVATVSSAGVAQAVCGGTAGITADYFGLTDTAEVTVIYDSLAEIAITPPAPAPVPIGDDLDLDAAVTYFDGSTMTVTGASPGLTWSSSNLEVATVTSAGVATAVGPGVSNISLAFTARGFDGATTCYELFTTPVPFQAINSP